MTHYIVLKLVKIMESVGIVIFMCESKKTHSLIK